MKNRMLSLKVNTVLVLFWLCMISDIHCYNSTKCIETERESLLKFKEGLVDTYGRLSSWGSEEDCCEWSGVHCSNRNRHVIMLDLSSYNSYPIEGNNITTRLHPMLELRHLSYLDLSYNDFRSSAIPKFIGSLPKLKYLDLSYTNFGEVQLGNPSNSFSFKNLCNLKYIDLSMTNLAGTLSYLLKDLDCAKNSLESLILTHNKLTGSINEDAIKRFSSLKKLSLGDNILNGFLPSVVGQLYELQHLDVSFNFFQGVISEIHFFNLSNLNYLDLSANTLALELSSHWISPFRLDFLSLSSCILGPRFPLWLQAQTKILYLNLSSCGISDNIPFWFWNQTTKNLRILDLSNNRLRGMLPDLSSSFTGYPQINLRSNYFVGPAPRFPSNLTRLDLSQNKFIGRLTFICSITNWGLIFLDLSDNLFAGGFPSCFENFQDITILNMAKNKLAGKIPSYSSAALLRLEILQLNSNRFFGGFPSTLKNSKSLRLLDISENKLSGNIPEWVGESLLKLSFLSLRFNKFNERIPTEICHLRNLKIMDLSQNSLSGSIPRCFANFTIMSGTRDSPIDVFNDNRLFVVLKGSSMKFGRSLEYLNLIDLSSNKLTGPFPIDITELTALRSLNLSQNRLSGSIPPEISRMEMLESLDLSRNNFSSEIPRTMAALTFLSVLNLSYNNFSGRIPTSSQFQTFGNTSYVGNSRLYGQPLREMPKNNAIVSGGGIGWFSIVFALGFSM